MKKKTLKVGRSDLLGEGEFGPAAEVLRKLARKHACITFNLFEWYDIELSIHVGALTTN
jgi:hypothetical protein